MIVQASPTDMEEVKNLIDALDNSVSSAVNDLRIVKVRNAIAADLADLLIRSLTPSIVQSNGPTGLLNLATTTGGAGGAFGGGGGAAGAFGGNALGGNAQNRPGGTLGVRAALPEPPAARRRPIRLLWV